MNPFRDPFSVSREFTELGRAVSQSTRFQELYQESTVAKMHHELTERANLFRDLHEESAAAKMHREAMERANQFRDLYEDSSAIKMQRELMERADRFRELYEESATEKIHREAIERANQFRQLYEDSPVIRMHRDLIERANQFRDLYEETATEKIHREAIERANQFRQPYEESPAIKMQRELIDRANQFRDLYEDSPAVRIHRELLERANQFRTLFRELPALQSIRRFTQASAQLTAFSEPRVFEDFVTRTQAQLGSIDFPEEIDSDASLGGTEAEGIQASLNELAEGLPENADVRTQLEIHQALIELSKRVGKKDSWWVVILLSIVANFLTDGLKSCCLFDVGHVGKVCQPRLGSDLPEEGAAAANLRIAAVPLRAYAEPRSNSLCIDTVPKSTAVWVGKKWRKWRFVTWARADCSVGYGWVRAKHLRTDGEK